VKQLREPEVANAALAHVGYDSFDGDASGLSMGDLSSILKRHRTVFLSVFLTIIALGALYIFGSHKKYMSTMVLMVHNARSGDVISAGRLEALPSTQEASDEELGSEVQLIQSADVLDEVVDPGWSKIPADQHSAAALQKHEQAVDILRNNLIVAPVKLSHVFTVELTTRSPYDSNHELNRLLDAFLAEKRRISHPSGASQMFAQQADLYRAQWEAAQARLTAFQQSRQLVTVGSQQELLQKEILDIDSLLRQSDVEIAEAQKKIDGDKAQVASIPSRVPTHETSIPASGSVDQMYARLSELKVQRTELLAKYRPDDRLVKEVDDKIKDVQTSLNDSRTMRSSETSTDVNPVWQQADQDLSETTAKLVGLVGRQKALRAQLDDLETRLSSVTEGGESFSLLQHQVAELDANYQLYAQKRDEARMTEVMDEHQLLNVAVIQAPTFSPNPVRPRPVLDSLLTMITALFLASFAVFLVHNSRPTAAMERELRSISRYPTLSNVPVRRELETNPETAKLEEAVETP
jgi:uncharacterized protein involved in exopolysaccharide biosynthesis